MNSSDDDEDLIINEFRKYEELHFSGSDSELMLVDDNYSNRSFHSSDESSEEFDPLKPPPIPYDILIANVVEVSSTENKEIKKCQELVIAEKKRAVAPTCRIANNLRGLITKKRCHVCKRYDKKHYKEPYHFQNVSRWISEQLKNINEPDFDAKFIFCQPCNLPLSGLKDDSHYSEYGHELSLQDFCSDCLRVIGVYNMTEHKQSSQHLKYCNKKCTEIAPKEPEENVQLQEPNLKGTSKKSKAKQSTGATQKRKPKKSVDLPAPKLTDADIEHFNALATNQCQFCHVPKNGPEHHKLNPECRKREERIMDDIILNRPEILEQFIRPCNPASVLKICCSKKNCKDKEKSKLLKEKSYEEYLPFDGYMKVKVDPKVTKSKPHQDDPYKVYDAVLKQIDTNEKMIREFESIKNDCSSDATCSKSLKEPESAPKDLPDKMENNTKASCSQLVFSHKRQMDFVSTLRRLITAQRCYLCQENVFTRNRKAKTNHYRTTAHFNKLLDYMKRICPHYGFRFRDTVAFFCVPCHVFFFTLNMAIKHYINDEHSRLCSRFCDVCLIFDNSAKHREHKTKFDEFITLETDLRIKIVNLHFYKYDTKVNHTKLKINCAMCSGRRQHPLFLKLWEKEAAETDEESEGEPPDWQKLIDKLKVTKDVGKDKTDEEMLALDRLAVTGRCGL
ncbi:uncharacterized protein LOC126736227 [Anthonomus grandis grandis]|uniref:uncharacterized protein LOC126736227 n=1 Tax=Anthonomus grandis grandis TaxID=2921223 RepID=UPI0021664AE8|nr:uncharacterized protein LOC126736227 [Anthonomus grandis grandis]